MDGELKRAGTFVTYKYQALGNDMLVVDPQWFELSLRPEMVRLLCDRHFGLGADGICFGPLGNVVDSPVMRFFNPDGSEAEKSGNGLRIFARYLVDAGYALGRQFAIKIGNEYMDVQQLDASGHSFAITMGRLSFVSQDIDLNRATDPMLDEGVERGDEKFLVTAVDIGNPHCVLFGQELSSISRIGPALENHPLFPQRTNVQLVQVLDAHTIRIAIWERGAGHTLASGTSACAAAGAAIRNGYCESPVAVQMDGGTAIVTIDEQWRATLAGTVAAVYQGALADELVTELLAISDLYSRRQNER